MTKENAVEKLEDTTVKLRKPVEVDGHKVSELTMRELTVADRISLEKAHGDKLPIEKDVFFFARMTNEPTEVITALCDRDWTRLKTRYWETLGNDEPA